MIQSRLDSSKQCNHHETILKLEELVIAQKILRLHKHRFKSKIKSSLNFYLHHLNRKPQLDNNQK